MHTYPSCIFESVVFVINRLPTSSLESASPYQVLFSKSPDYAFLKVLGCSCYPYTRPYAAHKLSPRSTPCVFLGYSNMYKGYKCLNLNTNKIYISRHVIFDEYSFPFTKTSTPVTSSLTPHPSSLVVIPPYHPPQQTSSSDNSDSLSSPITPSPPLRTLPASTSVPSPPVSNTPLLVYTRRTSSLSQKPSSTASLHPMQTRSKAKPPSLTTHALLSVCDPNVHSLDPTSYTQASKFQHWRNAMAQELAVLAHNNTWSLVPISEASNVVGCKWVFKTKRHSTGKIERYKARLVAKGYTQEEGLDFTDTFSPVVKPTTIRIILSFAVMNNWVI
jgi:Reverse transcriptase (RNA-dependent DNA polymerase)